MGHADRGRGLLIAVAQVAPRRGRRLLAELITVASAPLAAASAAGSRP